MVECKICLMKFKNDSILLSHINIHIGRKCKTCNQIYKSNEIANNNTARCIELHQWLLNESNKRKSMNVSIKKQPIVSYDTSTINIKNFNTKNDWQCQFCEYKTCTRHRLTKHMRTHTNERPYKCEECGKRFTVQCNLNQHFLSIHTKEKPFKCSECPLGFIRRDKLREHQRIHTGEKPFKCTFCQQMFARKSSLNKHIKMHVGFKCRFCANIFESESQLKQHKTLIHADVNPETGTKWFEFGCNLCQKRFFTKDLLKEHIKLHKGYPCDNCHSVFNTQIQLKNHKCKMFKTFANKIIINKPLKRLKDKILKDAQNNNNNNNKNKNKNKNNTHYCIECDKYFKSGQSLGGHKSRVHSKKRVDNNKKKKKPTQKLKQPKPQEKNELDILVETTSLLRTKREKKIGVNIFGEYDKNHDIKENKVARKGNVYRQTRSRKKKERKGLKLKDCPARHGLNKQLTPDDRVFECDECNKTMFLNEEMFGCRYCNYDLCVSCYYGHEWIFDLCVDQCTSINNKHKGIKVAVNKTELQQQYKCNEMIWYKESSNERSKWCEYIKENNVQCLDTKFMEYLDLRYVHPDVSDTNKFKELELFRNELNYGVFINKNVFNGDFIALKLLSTQYSANDDIVSIKAVIIKISSNVCLNGKPGKGNKENIGNYECKSMRFDYGTQQNENDSHEEKRKNKTNKKPKIVLRLNKKRKRNLSNNDNVDAKKKSPPRKKKKFTIKIPRLKKNK